MRNGWKYTAMSLLFIAVVILSAMLCAESQLTEKPNVVVAQDGSGDFRTIAEAILTAPNRSVERHYIKIRQGIYREYIQVNKKKTNIVLIGEGMDTTIITGVLGNGFTAQDITFRNEAGPENHQAVAIRVEANFASFYRCRFEGYQDTLYTKKYHQFYRDCEVYGTIDFICGDAVTLFQNCLIEVRVPLPRQYNTIIAQQRESEDDPTGIVLQNCTIKATQGLEKMNNVTTYFGRPWGKLSRTVVMESYVDHLINPRGWIEFTNKTFVRPFYLEYKNRGPGAVTKERVKWASVTSDSNIASNFTVRNFMKGDKWIPANIPHYLDLS
ncbi:pectinesterase/pectinesterase inhibitor PPE8B-like [Lycium barbarum]|uniref:pectinesterase/pectinesterase inhibitor PPE8B-like n=1 Tax=Lycium barbarum TaxID=112863 RepID=UPI00293EA9E5|nr:pectinesterase/pectinesterase inhibitor PPE8B-like [Lycium barbarum]